MKKLWNFCWDMYRKYEEGVNYLIFGFLAFVLNYLLYLLFSTPMHMDYQVATALSWALTVIFAYWTNRTFVFKSKNADAKAVGREFVSFIGARILTVFLELALMHVFVEWIAINDKIAKLICQFIVIVANYILSKLWIFKDKNKE